MDSQRWLGDLTLFLAVARAKSFARAADALDMSSSTVSRRIVDFEKSLGLRLLNRTTRCVELTEDGAEFLIRAERIDEEARVVQEDLRNRKIKPSGMLRVAMPESIATRLAIPWVAEFVKLYPDITLDIHTAPYFIDPVADQFDLCIHDHPVRNSSLTIRNLATFPRTLFASPAYVAEHGMPLHPHDLVHHQCLCLGTRESGRALWHLTRNGERVSVEVSGRIVSTSLDLGHLLVCEGVGIAAIITNAHSHEIIRGLRMPILPDWQFDPLIVSAIMPTKLIPAKTRLFLEFFAERMERVRQQLALPSTAALAHA